LNGWNGEWKHKPKWRYRGECDAYVKTKDRYRDIAYVANFCTAF
jgi:hypothetical protein